MDFVYNRPDHIVGVQNSKILCRDDLTQYGAIEFVKPYFLFWIKLGWACSTLHFLTLNRIPTVTMHVSHTEVEPGLHVS